MAATPARVDNRAKAHIMSVNYSVDGEWMDKEGSQSLIKEEASDEESESEFVRATYLIFLTSVAAMSALGFLSYHLLPRASLLPLGIADSLIWIACGWFVWREPIAFTFGLFTLITGLFLGQVAHISPHILGLSSVLSLIAFGGLSAYVHLSRQSFSFLRGFLWISFFILLGSCLLLPFAWNSSLNLLFATFGTFVFCCWILYDTSQILERRDELTPGTAAFELILDIVGLRSWLEGFLRGRG
jgi:FtsH-binding integral membrane protein